MALALTDEQVQITDAMAGFARATPRLGETRTHFDDLAAGGARHSGNALVAQGLHAVAPARVGRWTGR